MRSISGPRWLTSLIVIGLSVVGGVIFFGLWMVAAIPAAGSQNEFVNTILWILAPIITAVGFAAGAYLPERKLFDSQTRFVKVLIWPLIGCSIGAWCVFWFGPMLIVFGMLLFGTASITFRELYIRFQALAQERESSSLD